MDKKKCDGLTPAAIKQDACWKNYAQRGTKLNGGKRVPNCVPRGRKKQDTEGGRADLKCGRGAISKGEKCTKGAATQAKKGGLGSRFGGGIGGSHNRPRLLETAGGPATNLGKQYGLQVQLENRSKPSEENQARKAAGTIAMGALGWCPAMRRYGAFGETDLEADKRFRRRGDSMYAEGFKFDGKALHMESQNLAATDTERAKRKKNAQGQPKNFIYAKTRNT